jgi:AcrR family transcriptional regulator
VPDRQRADARRNRVRVLAAAEEAFAAEGLSVSIRDIAARAGVGRGTIGRHFPSKSALLGAVINGVLERLVEEARRGLQAPDPGEAFFAYFRLVLQEGGSNKALFDALSDSELHLKAAVAANAAEFARGFAALMRRAQHAGAVRRDLTAADLKALLVGALATQAHASDARSADRLAETTIAGVRAAA